MSTLADAKAGRVTPPGAKKFGWHSWAWLVWMLFFLIVEGDAVIKNIQGGRDDWQHRTLTENVRWLAATDRDGLIVKFGKFRRLALIFLMSWLVFHFFTDGEYV